MNESLLGVHGSKTLSDMFQEISCEQFMLESVHEG